MKKTVIILLLLALTASLFSQRKSDYLLAYNDDSCLCFGYKNRKGEIIIPAQFDFVLPFENGIAEYHIGGHRQYEPGREYWTWAGSDEVGYINHAGQRFTKISDLKDGKRDAWIGNRRVVLNKNGKIIQKPKLKQITRRYYVDKQGKELKEIPIGAPISLCAETKNIKKGEMLKFTLTDSDGRKYKGGIDTLKYQVPIGKKGKACVHGIIIQYEPDKPKYPTVYVSKQETDSVQAQQQTATEPIATDSIIFNREEINKFYDAIFNGNIEKVERMINTRQFPANYEPVTKITLLEAAIWANNIEIVKLLVEKGANINSKKTSAIEACAERSTHIHNVTAEDERKTIEILEYLLSKGGDVQHNAAFVFAGYSQNYEMAKLLLNHNVNQSGDIGGKFWVFKEAVLRSDYAVLDKLELDEDVLNYQDYNNSDTALIIAVRNNDVNMVKYLLNRGADRNTPEMFDEGDNGVSFGKLPIKIATENNFRKIVELLK
jgi:ankyrin repeat protein